MYGGSCSSQTLPSRVFELTREGRIEARCIRTVVETLLEKRIETGIFHQLDRIAVVRNLFWKDDQDGVGASRLP